MVNYSYANNNKTWETRDKLSPEQKLWIAVLGAAASDAVDDRRLTANGMYRSLSQRTADQEYFLTPNRSFFQICYWAGLDPEYVQRKMRKALCLKNK
jgi:hypothetical protein